MISNENVLILLNLFKRSFKYEIDCVSQQSQKHRIRCTFKINRPSKLLVSRELFFCEKATRLEISPTFKSIYLRKFRPFLMHYSVLGQTMTKLLQMYDSASNIESLCIVHLHWIFSNAVVAQLNARRSSMLYDNVFMTYSVTEQSTGKI